MSPLDFPITITAETIDEMCEILFRLRFTTPWIAECSRAGSTWTIRVRPVSA